MTTSTYLRDARCSSQDIKSISTGKDVNIGGTELYKKMCPPFLGSEYDLLRRCNIASVTKGG